MSAPSDQQAEQQTDTRGGTDGLPGVVVHVVVGGAARGLALLDHGLLQFLQAGLGLVDARGQALARGREIAAAGADMFVAGSAIFGKPDYKAVIDQMRAELAHVR